MRKGCAFSFLLPAFVLMLFFQNCSGVKFDESQAAREPQGGVIVDGGPTGPPGSPDQIFKSYEPSLVVRGGSCTVCHAEIRSNVITDFGWGPLGSSEDFIAADGYGENWDMDLLTGNVIIPADADVRAGGFYNSEIVEVDTLFIGAPTAADIRSAGGLTAAKKLSVTGSATGLQQSSTGLVQNTAELVCEGDVAVDGIVQLKDLRVRTTNGCRIYATETVFVNGPITYVGGSPNANLQIVSARGILLGFSKRTLEERLQRLGRARTRSGDLKQVLIADAGQLSGLVDADDSTYRSLTFNRLLLNAPVVQSRYSGLYEGSIIAELLLMRVGEMRFKFDPVFSRVPLVPLTKLEKSFRAK